jgi:PHS family inorganic phosphate transporter-like MFS transporter
MLGYVYGKSLFPIPHPSPRSPSSTDQKLNINQDLGVKVATPIGNLFGQILFGWLADIVGRKRMC